MPERECENGRLMSQSYGNNFDLLNLLKGSQGTPRIHGPHFENQCLRLPAEGLLCLLHILSALNFYFLTEMYDLHIVKCSNLKYIAQCIFANIHGCINHRSDQENISSILESSIKPFNTPYPPPVSSTECSDLYLSVNQICLILNCT